MFGLAGIRGSALREFGGGALKLFTILLIAGAALGAGTRTSAAWVKSMIAVDAYSGRVLRAYNVDAPHPPASLTKMMTLYLTFEALEHGKLRWNQYVTVSRHAATRMPSKIYLRPGHRYRIRDLVYAAAVKSANDAAVALGEAIGGSEFRFTRIMNRRARQIGMTNTYFGTASGLPARGQHTTARDMARLARALFLYHRKYYHIFSTRYYRFGRRVFASTNRLLRRGVAGIDGIKTGYTNRAHFNLVTSARRGKKRVITVVLGASTSRVRYRLTQRLLAQAWRARPRTRQYASIHRPNAERRTVVASAAKTPVSKAPVSKAKTQVRRAQVAAAPRFRRVTVGTTAPKTDTSKTGTSKTGTSKTAEPKSVVVADAGKHRKISLSIMGSRANAEERKPKSTTRNVVAKAEPPKTVKIARTKPAGPATKTIVTGTAYAVQVAASPRYALARRDADKALNALPGRLRRGALVAVMKPGDYKGLFYRARIVGLTKQNADAACRILKSKSLRCLAIRTSRRIQVASAARVHTPKAHAPKRTPRTARATPRSTDRDYVVQVGAVTRYASARRLARKARRSLPRTLSRRAQARILSPGSYRGRLYRVRLAGLSQAQAEQACRILKRRSVRCMPMRARASRSRRVHAAITRKGRFAVQVGAVDRRSNARRLIRKARRTLPRHLARRAQAQVLPPKTYAGRFYRARLTGLSRMEAMRACKILRHKSLHCLPYRDGDA